MIMLLLTIGAEFGGPHEDGQVAYGMQQDCVEAARLFRLTAEQGDVLAQKGLGLMYGLGQGVQQNLVESAKWYNRVAADTKRSQDNRG
jgi:TPR repeat protein